MLPAERRYTSGLLEVRDADSGGRKIGGYAAKFNKLSQNLGGFVERIDPAFFNKSASDEWPGMMARHNHEDNLLLGTTHAGTLRLKIDGTGLDYEADCPKCREDVFEMVSRGDIYQSSFAFRLPPKGGDEWSTTESGFPLRTLLTGQAIDVASVNSPAYLDTSTGLRSLAAQVEADFEEVRQAAEAGELRKFFAPPKQRFAVGGLIKHNAVVCDSGNPAHHASLPGHRQTDDIACTCGWDPERSHADHLADVIANRGAIPSHSTATVDATWDKGPALKNAPNDRKLLRHMHAWVDPDGDPDDKAAYKFPHHGPNEGSAANVSAVRNALARLESANIPDADKAKVKAHLDRHMKDAGKGDDKKNLSTGEQGATHLLIEIRRRRAELMKCRAI